MRGVGHQHTIAARQRQIGRHRGALVAAFFLDHLDQQNLAAADDILNLVVTAQVHALFAQGVGRGIIMRAGFFDDMFLAVFAGRGFFPR